MCIFLRYMHDCTNTYKPYMQYTHVYVYNYIHMQALIHYVAVYMFVYAYEHSKYYIFTKL